MLRNQYKPKLSVKLKNKLNGQLIVGDIINEEEIDGKPFWVVKTNGRVLKLAKDAYSVMKK